VFPLVCTLFGAETRVIAFIIEAPTVHQILSHLGELTTPPRGARARGPPRWDLPAAEAGGGDPLAQPAPAYEFD
jgi:hypothetical protein